jgi:hypothetical protein
VCITVKRSQLHLLLLSILFLQAPTASAVLSLHLPICTYRQHLTVLLIHQNDPNLQFKTYKIVYRRYAGLFFSLGIDVSDNELGALEAIHLFVEILDHYFSNVCELDLVFNFHKVRESLRQYCSSDM